MRRRLDPKDVEKRIRAWADVTMLSLELKLAVLRKKHPELGEADLRELMRRELSVSKGKLRG
jgi:hypothetical protein